MQTNRICRRCFLSAWVVLSGAVSGGWGQIITTVAGGGAGDGGFASQASFEFPAGVFVDGAGHLYIADSGNHRIRRIDAVTGIVTIVAGMGQAGFSGDGGPATQAGLSFPRGVSVDGSGHLYIADHDNNRIRRVDAVTGVITTVAGTGQEGVSGDGGPATQARLAGPQGVSVDGAGTLYIADSYNHRIRRVDATTGIITTVAGDFLGDGGPAIQAYLRSPNLSVDGAGNLYIGDVGNNRIRRVDGVTGIITTVAGTGEDGFSGDGGPATQARLSRPSVFVDGSGHLYITGNNRIRRVDATTGIITTLAGTGSSDWGNGGFSGDGGPATQARLFEPSGVFVDGAGHLYFADMFNSRVRRVDGATGIITTVAGTGGNFFGEGDPATRLGDGGPATEALMVLPSGVFVDGAGHLYIADSGNNRIRKVNLNPTVVADQMKPDQTATAFTLAQNYPNPFNPHTRIDYQLAQAGPVSLTIYNTLGQRLRVLVQEKRAAGVHQVAWDGRDASGREVADGVYVYRLASSHGVLTRRMLRLK